MPTIIRWPETIIAEWKLLELVSQEVTIDQVTKRFEFARRAPWVRMIIPHQDWSWRVLLSREYRPSLERYDYRLPGGKVFDSLSEFHQYMHDPQAMRYHTEQAVVREAKEEVWISILQMNQLALSQCGATVIWDLYYFEVTNYESGEQEHEEWEDISYDFYDIETVKQRCLDGTIDEERSAIHLLRYLSSTH